MTRSTKTKTEIKTKAPPSKDELTVRRAAAFTALKLRRRKETGNPRWNQSNFGEELGCSQSMVSCLLSGSERSAELEDKFAALFGKPVEFFFPGRTRNTPEPGTDSGVSE